MFDLNDDSNYNVNGMIDIHSATRIIQSVFKNDGYFYPLINMLEYDRIDVTEGSDTTQNKLISRGCWVCHFFNFIDENFSYQRYLCDGCHDVSMRAEVL